MLGERSRSVAGLAKPPSCVPQGREGLSKTTGADVRYRPAQARRFAAAPGREETAEALRRCVAGLDTPPICVPQRREGLSEATGADVRYRPAQARRFAAAPGREETAQALGKEVYT